MCYLVSVYIHIFISWPDLDPNSGAKQFEGDKIVRKVLVGLTENIDIYCDSYSNGVV